MTVQEYGVVHLLAELIEGVENKLSSLINYVNDILNTRNMFKAKWWQMYFWYYWGLVGRLKNVAEQLIYKMRNITCKLQRKIWNMVGWDNRYCLDDIETRSWWATLWSNPPWTGIEIPSVNITFASEFLSNHWDNFRHAKLEVYGKKLQESLMNVKRTGESRLESTLMLFGETTETAKYGLTTAYDYTIGKVSDSMVFLGNTFMEYILRPVELAMFFVGYRDRFASSCWFDNVYSIEENDYNIGLERRLILEKISRLLAAEVDYTRKMDYEPFEKLSLFLPRMIECKTNYQIAHKLEPERMKLTFLMDFEKDKIENVNQNAASWLLSTVVYYAKKIKPESEQNEHDCIKNMELNALAKNMWYPTELPLCMDAEDFSRENIESFYCEPIIEHRLKSLRKTWLFKCATYQHYIYTVVADCVNMFRNYMYKNDICIRGVGDELFIYDQLRYLFTKIIRRTVNFYGLEPEEFLEVKTTRISTVLPESHYDFELHVNKEYGIKDFKVVNNLSDDVWDVIEVLYTSDYIKEFSTQTSDIRDYNLWRFLQIVAFEEHVKNLPRINQKSIRDTVLKVNGEYVLKTEKNTKNYIIKVLAAFYLQDLGWVTTKRCRNARQAERTILRLPCETNFDTTPFSDAPLMSYRQLLSECRNVISNIFIEQFKLNDKNDHCISEENYLVWYAFVNQILLKLHTTISRYLPQLELHRSITTHNVCYYKDSMDEAYNVAQAHWGFDDFVKIMYIFPDPLEQDVPPGQDFEQYYNKINEWYDNNKTPTLGLDLPDFSMDPETLTATITGDYRFKEAKRLLEQSKMYLRTVEHEDGTVELAFFDKETNQRLDDPNQQDLIKLERAEKLLEEMTANLIDLTEPPTLDRWGIPRTGKDKVQGEEETQIVSTTNEMSEIVEITSLMFTSSQTTITRLIVENLGHSQVTDNQQVEEKIHESTNEETNDSTTQEETPIQTTVEHEEIEKNINEPQQDDYQSTQEECMNLNPENTETEAETENLLQSPEKRENVVEEREKEQTDSHVPNNQEIEGNQAQVPEDTGQKHQEIEEETIVDKKPDEKTTKKEPDKQTSNTDQHSTHGQKPHAFIYGLNVTNKLTRPMSDHFNKKGEMRVNSLSHQQLLKHQSIFNIGLLVAMVDYRGELDNISDQLNKILDELPQKLILVRIVTSADVRLTDKSIEEYYLNRLKVCSFKMKGSIVEEQHEITVHGDECVVEVLNDQKLDETCTNEDERQPEPRLTETADTPNQNDGSMNSGEYNEILNETTQPTQVVEIDQETETNTVKTDRQSGKSEDNAYGPERKENATNLNILLVSTVKNTATKKIVNFLRNYQNITILESHDIRPDDTALEQIVVIYVIETGTTDDSQLIENEYTILSTKYVTNSKIIVINRDELTVDSDYAELEFKWQHDIIVIESENQNELLNTDSQSRLISILQSTTPTNVTIVNEEVSDYEDTESNEVTSKDQPHSSEESEPGKRIITREDTTILELAQRHFQDMIAEMTIGEKPTAQRRKMNKIHRLRTTIIKVEELKQLDLKWSKPTSMNEKDEELTSAHIFRKVYGHYCLNMITELLEEFDQDERQSFETKATNCEELYKECEKTIIFPISHKIKVLAEMQEKCVLETETFFLKLHTEKAELRGQLLDDLSDLWYEVQRTFIPETRLEIELLISITEDKIIRLMRSSCLLKAKRQCGTKTLPASVTHEEERDQRTNTILHTEPTQENENEPDEHPNGSERTREKEPKEQTKTDDEFENVQRSPLEPSSRTMEEQEKPSHLNNEEEKNDDDKGIRTNSRTDESNQDKKKQPTANETESSQQTNTENDVTSTEHEERIEEQPPRRDEEKFFRTFMRLTRNKFKSFYAARAKDSEVYVTELVSKSNSALSESVSRCEQQIEHVLLTTTTPKRLQINEEDCDHDNYCESQSHDDIEQTKTTLNTCAEQCERTYRALTIPSLEVTCEKITEPISTGRCKRNKNNLIAHSVITFENLRTNINNLLNYLESIYLKECTISYGRACNLYGKKVRKKEVVIKTEKLPETSEVEASNNPEKSDNNQRQVDDLEEISEKGKENRERRKSKRENRDLRSEQQELSEAERENRELAPEQKEEEKEEKQTNQIVTDDQLWESMKDKNRILNEKVKDVRGVLGAIADVLEGDYGRLVNRGELQQAQELLAEFDQTVKEIDDKYGRNFPTWLTGTIIDCINVINIILFAINLVATIIVRWKAKQPVSLIQRTTYVLMILSHILIENTLKLSISNTISAISSLIVFHGRIRVGFKDEKTREYVITKFRRGVTFILNEITLLGITMVTLGIVGMFNSNSVLIALTATVWLSSETTRCEITQPNDYCYTLVVEGARNEPATITKARFCQLINCLEVVPQLQGVYYYITHQTLVLTPLERLLITTPLDPDTLRLNGKNVAYTREGTRFPFVANLNALTINVITNGNYAFVGEPNPNLTQSNKASGNPAFSANLLTNAHFARHTTLDDLTRILRECDVTNTHTWENIRVTKIGKHAVIEIAEGVNLTLQELIDTNALLIKRKVLRDRPEGECYKHIIDIDLGKNPTKDAFLQSIAQYPDDYYFEDVATVLNGDLLHIVKQEGARIYKETLVKTNYQNIGGRVPTTTLMKAPHAVIDFQKIMWFLLGVILIFMAFLSFTTSYYRGIELPLDATVTLLQQADMTVKSIGITADVVVNSITYTYTKAKLLTLILIDSTNEENVKNWNDLNFSDHFEEYSWNGVLKIIIAALILTIWLSNTILKRARTLYSRDVLNIQNAVPLYDRCPQTHVGRLFFTKTQDTVNNKLVNSVKTKLWVNHPNKEIIVHDTINDTTIGNERFQTIVPNGPEDIVESEVTTKYIRKSIPVTNQNSKELLRKFSQLGIDYHIVDRENSGHPDAAVVTKFARERIRSIIGDGARVLVVGANPTAWIGIPGYYCLSPEIDNRDSRRIHESDKIQWENDNSLKTTNVFRKKLEDVTGSFTHIVLIHSCYDIPMGTVFEAARRMGVSTVINTMHWTDSMLVYDQGYLPIHNVIYDMSSANSIKFTMTDAHDGIYYHNIDNFTMWGTTGMITFEGRADEEVNAQVVKLRSTPEGRRLYDAEYITKTHRVKKNKPSPQDYEEWYDRTNYKRTINFNDLEIAIHIYDVNKNVTVGPKAINCSVSENDYRTCLVKEKTRKTFNLSFIIDAILLIVPQMTALFRRTYTTTSDTYNVITYDETVISTAANELKKKETINVFEKLRTARQYATTAERTMMENKNDTCKIMLNHENNIYLAVKNADEIITAQKMAEDDDHVVVELPPVINWNRTVNLNYVPNTLRVTLTSQATYRSSWKFAPKRRCRPAPGTIDGAFTYENYRIPTNGTFTLSIYSLLFGRYHAHSNPKYFEYLLFNLITHPDYNLTIFYKDVTYNILPKANTRNTIYVLRNDNDKYAFTGKLLTKLTVDLGSINDITAFFHWEFTPIMVDRDCVKKFFESYIPPGIINDTNKNLTLNELTKMGNVTVYKEPNFYVHTDIPKEILDRLEKPKEVKNPNDVNINIKTKNSDEGVTQKKKDEKDKGKDDGKNRKKKKRTEKTDTYSEVVVDVGDPIYDGFQPNREDVEAYKRGEIRAHVMNDKLIRLEDEPLDNWFQRRRILWCELDDEELMIHFNEDEMNQWTDTVLRALGHESKMPHELTDKEYEEFVKRFNNELNYQIILELERMEEEEEVRLQSLDDYSDSEEKSFRDRRTEEQQDKGSGLSGGMKGAKKNTQKTQKQSTQQQGSKSKKKKKVQKVMFGQPLKGKKQAYIYYNITGSDETDDDGNQGPVIQNEQEQQQQTVQTEPDLEVKTQQNLEGGNVGNEQFEQEQQQEQEQVVEGNEQVEGNGGGGPDEISKSEEHVIIETRETPDKPKRKKVDKNAKRKQKVSEKKVIVKKVDTKTAKKTQKKTIEQYVDETEETEDTTLEDISAGMWSTEEVTEEADMPPHRTNLGKVECQRVSFGTPPGNSIRKIKEFDHVRKQDKEIFPRDALVLTAEEDKRYTNLKNTKCVLLVLGNHAHYVSYEQFEDGVGRYNFPVGTREEWSTYRRALRRYSVMTKEEQRKVGIPIRPHREGIKVIPKHLVKDMTECVHNIAGAKKTKDYEKERIILSKTAQAKEFLNYLEIMNEKLTEKFSNFLKKKKNMQIEATFKIYDTKKKEFVNGPLPGQRLGYDIEKKRMVKLKWKQKSGRYDVKERSYGRYIVMDDSIFMWSASMAIAKIVERSGGGGNKRNRAYTLIEGVPGCGKTTEIATTARDGDLLLTATRASKTILRRYLKNLAKENLMKNVKTYDSVIINGIGNRSFTRMLCDEAFMVHAGVIEIISDSTTIDEVILYGDRRQIPFMSRIPEIEFKSNKLEFSTILERNTTHRLPKSTVQFLKEQYPRMETTSPLQGTMRVEKFFSIEQIPKDQQVLTFTQFEKSVLNNQGFKTLTIHESQGSTYKNVVVVRLQQQDNAIYESIPHIIVGTTRHRENWTYITAAPFDKLTQYIAENRIKELDASYKSGQINYEIVHTSLVTKHTSIIEYEGKLNDDNESFFRSLGMTRDRVTVEEVSYSFENREENSGTERTTMDSKSNRSKLGNIYDDIIGRREPEVFDSVVNSSLQVTIPELFIYDERNFTNKQNINTTPNPVECRIPVKVDLTLPNTTQTALNALLNRNINPPQIQGLVSEKDSEKVVNWFIEKMFDSGKLKNAMNNDKPTGTDFLVWYNSRPKGKKKVYTRTKPDTYRAHVKNREKFKGDGSHEYTVGSGQVIAAQGQDVVAYCTPFIKYLDRIIKKALKNRFVINDGYSLNDLEGFLNYHLKEKSKKVEIDFSKFDKSQNAFILNIQLILMAKLGIEPHFIEFWSKNHEKTTLDFRNHGFKINVDHQRKSGDAFTFLGNTIVTMMVLNYVLDLDKAICALFGGDDSFIAFEANTTIPDVVQTIALTFNLHAKFENVEKSMMFSSKYLINTTKGWKISADPIRLLVRVIRNDLKNSLHIFQNWLALIEQTRHWSDIETRDKVSQMSFERNPILKGVDQVLVIMETLYNCALSYTHFRKLYRIMIKNKDNPEESFRRWFEIENVSFTMHEIMRIVEVIEKDESLDKDNVTEIVRVGNTYKIRRRIRGVDEQFTYQTRTNYNEGRDITSDEGEIHERKIRTRRGKVEVRHIEMLVDSTEPTKNTNTQEQKTTGQNSSNTINENVDNRAN